MPLPFPHEWIISPPRYIVAGEGPYSRVLAQVLSGAALVSNELLREGVSPPPLASGKDFHRTPLKENLEAVLVVSAEGEPSSSLIWRHRRLWMLPGRQIKGHGWKLDEIGWLLITADQKQAQNFSELDLMGRNPPQRTFASWSPQSYRLLPRQAGLRRILTCLAELEPTPTTNWINVLNQDLAAKALRGFKKYLSQTADPYAALQEIPKLQRYVPSLSWEQHFPPPQHQWANKMRKWLAVTQPDTPWLKEGKSLISNIHI